MNRQMLVTRVVRRFRMHKWYTTAIWRFLFVITITANFVAFPLQHTAQAVSTNLSDTRVYLPAVSGARSMTTLVTSSNPSVGAKWYIDPNSNARKQADAWRATRPEDAAQMDKIAGQPSADWFGDWNGDIYNAVNNRVSTITAVGALPVLVAYNIPKRDCGSYSSGGAKSPDTYKRWIRSFAKGIGARKALVILEPDALAAMTCLSNSDQQTRLALIKDAISVLEARPGVSVYVDAGHPGWVSAQEMASRLKEAGVSQAQGFALNVSNFAYTSDNIRYGKDLSTQIDGKHFIIDTSRNGLGPTDDYQWCNPPGRALGSRPTTTTGDPLVDLYFWIKRPGESDGTCNGGPSAGTWWAEYALGLAQRANY